MSYDLSAFKLPPGADPATSARDVYSVGVEAVKRLADEPPKRRRWWQRRP